MTDYFKNLDNFHKKCAEQNVQNICSYNELVNYPVTTTGSNGQQIRTSNWVTNKNKDDGHCFYHAVMRLIYRKEKKHYVIANQTPRRLVLLREAVIPIIKELAQEKNEPFDEVFFTTALQNAKNGRHTSNWAGSSSLGELEFQAMANLLQVCIIIWQKKTGEDWGWTTFTPSNVRQGVYNGFDNFNNKATCPDGVMYIYNKDSNHFDTLVPLVHRTSSRTRRISPTRRISRIKTKTLSDNDKFVNKMESEGKNIADILKALEISKGNIERAEYLLNDTGLTELLVEMKEYDPETIIELYKANNGNVEATRAQIIGNFIENGGGRKRQHKRTKKSKRTKKRKGKRATRRK